jgi:hypothetical protein
VSVPKTLKELERFIVDLGLVEPLDIYVEDAKYQEAHKINTKGLSAQIECLARRLSLPDIHAMVLRERDFRTKYKVVSQHKSGLGPTTVAKDHPAYKRQPRHEIDKAEVHGRLKKSMKRLKQGRLF